MLIAHHIISYVTFTNIQSAEKMMNCPLYIMHNLSNQHQILVLVEFLGSNEEQE